MSEQELQGGGSIGDVVGATREADPAQLNVDQQRAVRSDAPTDRGGPRYRVPDEPPPVTDRTQRGILVRLLSRLHYFAKAAAHREQRSLNDFCTAAIAERTERHFGGLSRETQTQEATAAGSHDNPAGA